MLNVSAHGTGNLLECLRLEGLLPESPCNGKGLCGKCRVRVISGAVSPLTEQDLLWHAKGDDTPKSFTGL